MRIIRKRFKRFERTTAKKDLVCSKCGSSIPIGTRVYVGSCGCIPAYPEGNNLLVRCKKCRIYGWEVTNSLIYHIIGATIYLRINDIKEILGKTLLKAKKGK